MKLSELIRTLTAIQAALGDLQVTMKDNDSGQARTVNRVMTSSDPVYLDSYTLSDHGGYPHVRLEN